MSRARHAVRRAGPPGRRVVLAALLALVLTACGGQPDQVSWRNVTVPVPDGWYVIEESATHLSLSNADLGPQEVLGAPAADRDDDVVAMYFTYEPGTLPRDWLELIDAQGATLESDAEILLDDGDVPARRIVFSSDADGTPTREMVVLIPSRWIVVLSLPIPAPGSTDAPETFLRTIDTFLEVLETSDYGAPLLE